MAHGGHCALAGLVLAMAGFVCWAVLSISGAGAGLRARRASCVL